MMDFLIDGRTPPGRPFPLSDFIPSGSGTEDDSPGPAMVFNAIVTFGSLLVILMLILGGGIRIECGET